MGCKRSDPSVLRLGNGVVRLKYWQIPVYSSWKKKAFEKQWNLFCHLQCCYTTQGRKHPLSLLLLEQLHVANVHWFDINVSTPTKSHPLKFNYCEIFFAVPSALAKFAKDIIALRYFEGGTYCAQSYQFCSYYLRTLSNLCSEDFEWSDQWQRQLLRRTCESDLHLCNAKKYSVSLEVSNKVLILQSSERNVENHVIDLSFTSEWMTCEYP